MSSKTCALNIHSFHSGLIKGIDSLCMYFNGDGVVTESLGKFGYVLEEALSYFMVIIQKKYFVLLLYEHVENKI